MTDAYQRALRAVRREADIAFSRLADVLDDQGNPVPPDALAESVRNAIARYEVQPGRIVIEFRDKLAALEALLRRFGPKGD